MGDGGLPGFDDIFESPYAARKVFFEMGQNRSSSGLCQILRTSCKLRAFAKRLFAGADDKINNKTNESFLTTGYGPP